MRDKLRELARNEAIREALALASPDLASRLDAWLEGSLQGKVERNIEQSLVKYLSRMSSRCTPFGLFAGVSLGTWGPASRLSVESWTQGRTFVRLDWGVLETLVDHLEQEPQVRSCMVYGPNSSLFLQGGWYRYLERRDQAGQGRSYHLEAVEATPHLDFVLQQAGAGAGLEALALSLARHMEVEPAVAHAYLNQLVDAQVLCGKLGPPLTDPDPLGRVINTLRDAPALAPKAAALVALNREMQNIQESPLGSFPKGYANHLTSLEEAVIASGTRDVLQVDLFRPAPGLALSPTVRQALEQGADLLRRLTPPPVESPLDRFRAAFEARYGSRWMPLLEVLDEESGIGFDGAPALDSPLLAGLPFQGQAPPRPLTRRDLMLMAQLQRLGSSRTWDLEDEDLESLANPEPQPFPASFAALATLGAASSDALDRGEFQFWMENYSGPTAARWLGRFASGDSALKDLLLRHLQKEEASIPDAVFAEVVHVPEGRLGNVLARPALRDYEIPFLAAPGVSGDKVIPPSDLRVTVRGNIVFLASARLGREVIPRLSSAHNYLRGQVVYRFLAHLQDQGGRPGGWSWGALAEQPFLPRVVRGRHVLSKARWRLEAKELKAAMAGSSEGAWGAFRLLRESRGLPRFVLLTDADNHLRVDLDEALWVEALHHLVSSRPAFTLTECFPDPGQTLVTSPEGRCAHELVIPFEAATSLRRNKISFSRISQTSGIRAFPPGSEWLYLKLYCGPASADRLLVELEPLIQGTKELGLWDRWHFIRYRDPAPHLRLRFHGRPSQLLAELLPRFQAQLAEHLAQGFVSKIQLDTFEPELERYGGPLGFALAESWFFEDSQRILEQLSVGLALEERWKAGLKDVDGIWAALGLDVPARKELAQTSRDGFRKEFQDSGEGAVQIGKKFRDFRKELETGFPLASGSAAVPGFSGLIRLREASGEGTLQGEFPGIAQSLSHMHLNRLLRTNHRENEWVIMEFLARLYESCLARFPGASLMGDPQSREAGTVKDVKIRQ
ncbi:MAG: lantibiotic dehydratase [Acidobacteriota bacterium]|nr:lantibiotic dehydratase [Acidobacteriota bacterium]